MPSTELPNLSKSIIGEFLQKIEKLPIEIIDGLLKAAKDEDVKLSIETFAPAFKAQFKELATFINDSYAVASKQRIVETERFLKISSGILLLDNAKAVVANPTSIITRMSIADLVIEIKKIIRKILELIFGSLPGWVDDIINIVDEILHILIGLGIIGGEGLQLRNALSRKEQNFLAELTQLSMLHRATKAIRNDESDEE